MDDTGGDLLEDMDYGDFGLLEETSGDFSFSGAFDNEDTPPDFNDSGGSLSAVAVPPLPQQPLPSLQSTSLPKQALQPPPPMRSMGPPPPNPIGAGNLNSTTIPNSTSASSGGNSSSAGGDNNNNNNSAFRSLPNDNNEASSSLRPQVRTTPRQPWHNDEQDRDARRRMIIEIAQLLRARKRTQPSDSWLRQLPCKARKLEERLYRSAVSKDIYEDRTSLKNRLKKLARAIMLQHEGSSGTTRSSFRSSLSSIPSVASSRGSISVVSHLQQHRDSFMSQNSLDSLSTLNNQMNQQMGGLGVAKDRGKPPGGGVGGDHPPNNGQSGGTGSATAVAPTASPAASTAGATGSTATLSMQSIPEEKKGSLSSSGTDKITMLEQQKQANERLQQQIMENIRKQELLLKRLQMQAAGGNSDAGNTGTNNTSNGLNPSQLPQQNNSSGPSNPMQRQNSSSAGQSSASLVSHNSNNSWGARSTSSQGNTSMQTSLSSQQNQQMQQQLPPQQQQQGMNRSMNVAGNPSNMNAVAMQGNLNSFMQMNAAALNNPVQMQQLAQMRALLGSNPGMMQMAQANNNPLMRSASVGSSGTPNAGQMMAGFATQPQQAQMQQSQQGQQNPQMAIANMFGQTMIGLSAPPVIPGRSVSTGQIPTYPGFNPSMPPPPGSGATTTTQQGNNAAAFGQFNWRPST